jgi:hypothetical protein
MPIEPGLGHAGHDAETSLLTGHQRNAAERISDLNAKRTFGKAARATRLFPPRSQKLIEFEATSRTFSDRNG